jgi:uncharacterized membrane protein
MKTILLLPLLFLGPSVLACTTCNTELQQSIFDSSFYPTLSLLFLVFFILGILVVLLAFLATRYEKRRRFDGPEELTIVPLLSASTTLGIGLGGFIDGTIFHQILQWHEMLSNRIPPLTLINKSINMFWDGVFHLLCLIVTIVGVLLLTALFFRKDVIVTWKAFIGGLFFGWGLFNVMEGIADHHLLNLHNVRELTDDIAYYNYAFLVISVLILLIGAQLIRSGSPRRW